jgi:glycosyltransferase involved in cell wall biosynthesis
MLSIICSTKEPSEDFKRHILKSCGFFDKNEEQPEFIFYENKNQYSLTEVYNKGLKESKHNIVVFLHDDIEIKTKQWGKKLLKLLHNNGDYGVIGVAGTKHLPESVKWWENRKMMYGRVEHTHQGKTWLSAYSDDLGNNISETVIVDGVFFVVDKTKLKSRFDENIRGFHFYDVDFCLSNHIEGVKIGVTTAIRINHHSIGMTNDEWEKNREIVSEKYKDNLPIRLYEDFSNRKMKVLIGCLSFANLTGSELSNLETAKGLTKNGCDVTVVSANISNNFVNICKNHGIKVYKIDEPPHYKLGDGMWLINTPEGSKPSQKNVLYRVNHETFDVIHANHTPITQRLLQLYPESNFVNIVRSEVIDLENPVVDDKIKKYIAIRPSIKDYITNNFNISEDKVEVIYNPFDKNRFKPMTLPSGTDKKVTLFVGTMDYLREKPINDLVNKCKDENKELWLVGKDIKGYAKYISTIEDHVKYFEPTDKIEEFYYKCDETAGIMLGRTTIEGFLCGKPAIIYDVDKQGEILRSTYHKVPNDLNIFDYDVVINKFKCVYVESFNNLWKI